MHLILLLVGVLAAVAGIAMVRMAVPIEDVGGAALFISGIVALIGALIIAALAAAVRSLNRIVERLEIQPLPVPPIASVGRDDPAPRPVRVAPPPAAAGAARPSLLGWLGRASVPAPASAARTPPRATPAPEPEDEPVDLGPLTRILEPLRETPPLPSPTPAPTPAKPAPVSAPAPNLPPEATVYRSGVIDGMAYTLFMDGSIQAELPQGTVKFDTVDDLQKHLLGNR